MHSYPKYSAKWLHTNCVSISRLQCIHVAEYLYFLCWNVYIFLFLFLLYLSYPFKICTVFIHMCNRTWYMPFPPKYTMKGLHCAHIKSRVHPQYWIILNFCFCTILSISIWYNTVFISVNNRTHSIHFHQNCSME